MNAVFSFSCCRGDEGDVPVPQTGADRLIFKHFFCTNAELVSLSDILNFTIEDFRKRLLLSCYDPATYSTGMHLDGTGEQVAQLDVGWSVVLAMSWDMN